MLNTSSSAFFSNQVRNGDSLRVNDGIIHKENSPIEATYLGKRTEYKFTYDPNLLVPVPRQENRNTVGLKNDNLPFIGFDVWNAYEWTCLTTTGVPVVGILKIVYPCESEFLVESKSLKLYLNGFNMEKMGATSSKCMYNCEEIIRKDLSNALKTIVKVKIFPSSQWNYNQNSEFNKQFIDLDALIEETYPNLICNVYKETPKLLVTTVECEPTAWVGYKTASIRSCCKVTHAPDYGTYYIKYKAQKIITPDSLFQYLISFRDEFHFHEECGETCFKRLYDILNPIELLVACFYTRRGGIDINVVRSTSDEFLDTLSAYLDPLYLSYKQPRQ